MSETDGLDKLRTWAYGHMGDANTIAREVRTVLDLLPPADLPATLASVDDVRRVCEAAGLTERGHHRWWHTDGVEVQWWERRGQGQLTCAAWAVRYDGAPPGAQLWRAIADAIQAARSGS